MKKLVFIMMALVLSVSMAMAQGKGPKGDRQGNVDPKVRAEKVTEKMATDLSLTAKQKQAVYDLNLAAFEKRNEFRENRKATNNGQKPEKPTAEEREQFNKEKQANREAYNNALKKILTPAQFEKYTQQKSDCKKNDQCKKSEKCTKEGDKKGKPGKR